MSKVLSVISIFILITLTGCSSFIVGKESPSSDMAYIYYTRDIKYVNTNLNNASFALEMKSLDNKNTYHLTINGRPGIKTQIYKVAPGRYKLNSIKFSSRLSIWHDNFTGKYKIPKNEFALKAGKLYFIGHFNSLITQQTSQLITGQGTIDVAFGSSDSAYIDFSYLTTNSKQSVSMMRDEHTGFVNTPVVDLFTENTEFKTVIK